MQLVNQYKINDPRIILKSDLASEFPIYIYWSKELDIFLYSKSIKNLLNDNLVKKPLDICNKGLSFLLQSNVVPPPQTSYKDVYILGIGDQTNVCTIDNKIDVKFEKTFPFMNFNRLPPEEMKPDENLILEMLAEATLSRIDKSKPSFLFHSSGKDSNSIALALAEAGLQNRFTLITHKGEGLSDESEISKKIAKQLGFKHKIIHKVDELKIEHKQEIENYQNKVTLPSTDGVTLGYPLYAQQISELKNANIIDGGGNDSSMMVLPSARDLKFIAISKITHYASFLRNLVKSESLLSPLIRTPAEWCGMSGMSFSDTKKIFENAVNVFPYWKEITNSRKSWDIVDFNTSILAFNIASELHIRKVRIFADTYDSNLILPFANEKVATYFAKMPEKYLFDRKKLKNKLILRKILKNKIGLDSDALGKRGWNYQANSIIKKNSDWFMKEILSSSLWNKLEIKKLTNRFLKIILKNTKYYSNFSNRMIYRLYLLSVWKSKNKYLNY